MRTAVDANIFFDLLSGPADVAEIAYAALASAKESGDIVVSMICYAEVSRSFGSQQEAGEFFDQLGCRLDRMDEDQAFLAGRFFTDYKRRGGTRTRILGDFLIAAHAQLNADRILTRDVRFFGPNFPGLKAVTPAELS